MGYPHLQRGGGGGLVSGTRLDPPPLLARRLSARVRTQIHIAGHGLFGHQLRYEWSYLGHVLNALFVIAATVVMLYFSHPLEVCAALPLRPSCPPPPPRDPPQQV